MLTLVCQTAAASVKHTEQNTDGIFLTYFFPLWVWPGKVRPLNHESQAAGLLQKRNVDILDVFKTDSFGFYF